MPSLAQLQAEPWWSREIITDELDWLGDELCRRSGRSRDAFGSKGNTAHLSGGHRSQEWLKNSDWCENRSYTVQSGLSSDQARHIGACDFTPGDWGTASNRALMKQMTRQLFDAARSGRLVGVRQIFGTLDGVRAIGLNVQTNSTTVPDDSHLEHIHLTFDRKYLRDSGLMARIADIITGEDMPNSLEYSAAWIVQRLSEMAPITIPADSSIGYTGYTAPNKLAEAINKLVAAAAADETRDAVTLAAIQSLSAGTGGDPAPVLEAIRDEAEKTRALVETVHQQEMAALKRDYDAEVAGLRAELEQLAQ